MEKTVIVQEDPTTGNLFIEIPLEMIKKLGWEENDDLKFSPIEGEKAFNIINTSLESRKKLKKENMPVFLVETVETRKVTYLIRAKEDSHSHDEIVTRDAVSISNEKLDESIFTTKEISEEEAKNLTDKCGGKIHKICY